MTDTSNEIARPPRWQRWLLITSLALNLAVAGVVIGAFVRGGPDGHREGRVDLTLGPVVDALPDTDRRALRRAIMSSGRLGPESRRALRADFDQVLDLLRAPEFDEAALSEVLSRQRGRVAEVQDAALDALLDRISAMDPATRAAFADRLENRLSSGRR